MHGQDACKRQTHFTRITTVWTRSSTDLAGTSRWLAASRRLGTCIRTHNDNKFCTDKQVLIQFNAFYHLTHVFWQYSCVYLAYSEASPGSCPMPRGTKSVEATPRSHLQTGSLTCSIAQVEATQCCPHLNGAFMSAASIAAAPLRRPSSMEYTLPSVATAHVGRPASETVLTAASPARYSTRCNTERWVIVIKIS
jgi:hypothetical protein